MHIRRLASGATILAPAKLNLFFEVLGKRTDGFHEVETLICPINLYDTLYFRDIPGEAVSLKCRLVFGEGGPKSRGLSEVTEGRENLVHRAVELVRRRAGIERGAELLLVKRIPAAAGLGGGSSDAAAALAAANEVWRLGRTAEQLARWAEELGSDVPFFLAGGPALCRGRGERIAPVSARGELHFVVVRPPEGLATAAVYAACQPAERPRAVQPLLDAIGRGDLKRIGLGLWNRLQPAAEKLSPWMERLGREFARLNLQGHGMSGSGTSYFGLCRNARDARRIAGQLRSRSIGVVFAVRSCL
ncbi:MAG: 4-(cytidine 5'-diphospho)-2-C-methyl-D-erythritol kinase [Pirellulaceae bacterium]|nr:4-(cytidine 5'-diphospho)-2-C-methyl-D-erythritol kinase [Pirellulaceae bacterium]